MSKNLKSAITVRGDFLYCPLPLALDSYWNCLTDCHHCYFRRLNRTWGTDLRPADPDEVRKKLENGLKNKNPKTPLAVALSLKKTIRVGNKTDPFQEVENELQVTRRIIEHLIDLRWTFVIQTRFLHNVAKIEPLLRKANQRNLLTIMPIISPGAELDWDKLERRRTTPIIDRLELIQRWIKKGWHVGVNGEPFIPGYHTVEMFERTLKLVKGVGCTSYNTYNFHWNDYVVKRLYEIGLDIEKIWEMNQDGPWKEIQKQLCQVADRVGMTLGCPDFVNTGPGWKEKANTCCGIHVTNPSKFNTHWWKKKLQAGKLPEEVLSETWEGIGDYEQGRKIVYGEACDLYTMKDAGMTK